MKYYHGSPQKGIEHFHLDTEERHGSVEGRGLYITDNYKIAREYAGSEGSVYELDIKNQAIFDASSKEEFFYCLEQASKLINFNLLNLDYLEETVEGLINGQYRITGSNDSGLSWQIRNLLDNNEFFISSKSNDCDEIFKKLGDFLDDYLKQHSILKYNDMKLGLVYLSFEPEKLKIINEIIVGSTEDEAYL